MAKPPSGNPAVRRHGPPETQKPMPETGGVPSGTSAGVADKPSPSPRPLMGLLKLSDYGLVGPAWDPRGETVGTGQAGQGSDLSAELEELKRATASLRSMVREGTTLPERGIDALRNVFDGLEAHPGGSDTAGASVLLAQLLEYRAEEAEILFAALARLAGGRPQALKAIEAEMAIREGRADVARAPAFAEGDEGDTLAAEVRAMLERGDPPERYSERKDRKEGAREFLARVYGRYLRKGDESIYLHEIRRLDPKFVRSLEIACRRAGEPVWLSVPKRSDLTERILASVAPEKLDAVTKAAEALVLRKRRAAAKSHKA